MKKTMTPKNPHAVALGRLGGSVTSEAKAKAVRANGKKGGRPRLPIPAINGEDMRSYSLTHRDIGKYAVIQWGYACLAVGKTSASALRNAMRSCGYDGPEDEFVTDRREFDGDTTVELVEEL